MPKRSTRAEARDVILGYVSGHKEEPDLLDAGKWKQAAALELAARRLTVVKALSDETLQAIVDGTVDAASLYAAALKDTPSRDAGDD